jgi:MurNAc alpha-1-phosphate uridylyltransferase
MKAMILAAGRGERMRPLTDSTPKPLLEVQGQSLIEYHLQALSRAGINEVVINLSWLGQQIREKLGNGSQFDLEIEYSEETQALETAGGILQALPLLGDQFIVVNADIFTDYDFAQLGEVDSLAHLVLAPNPEQHPQGDFSLTNSVVGNLGETFYTFTGIAKYQRCFFEGMIPGKRALAPDLRKAAELGQVSGELYSGSWYDIGTLERLQYLQQALNSES